MGASIRYTVKFGMANLGNILAGTREEALMRAETMAWQHLGDLFRHLVDHRSEKELRQSVQDILYQRTGAIAIVASRTGMYINCRLTKHRE